MTKSKSIRLSDAEASCKCDGRNEMESEDRSEERCLTRKCTAPKKNCNHCLPNIRVAEPEPPGAGLFGWSRSRSRKKYEVSAPAPAPAPGEL